MVSLLFARARAGSEDHGRGSGKLRAYSMKDTVRPPVSREPTTGMRRLVRKSQRSRIVDAALRILASRGFHPQPPTVEQLSTEAGVARNTFYDHFPNAEEAFRAASSLALDRPGHLLLADGDAVALINWVIEDEDHARVALIHSPAVDLDGWARLFTIGTESTAEELERAARPYLARSMALSRSDLSKIRGEARRRRGRPKKRSLPA